MLRTKLKQVGVVPGLELNGVSRFPHYSHATERKREMTGFLQVSA